MKSNVRSVERSLKLFEIVLWLCVITGCDLSANGVAQWAKHSRPPVIEYREAALGKTLDAGQPALALTKAAGPQRNLPIKTTLSARRKLTPIFTTTQSRNNVIRYLAVQVSALSRQVVCTWMKPGGNISLISGCLQEARYEN